MYVCVFVCVSLRIVLTMVRTHMYVCMCILLNLCISAMHIIRICKVCMIISDLASSSCRYMCVYIMQIVCMNMYINCV